MKLSVILPTHNPDPVRLGRTLAGLRAQALPPEQWETLIVNNASGRFPDTTFFSAAAPANYRIIDEPRLGLTSARLRGFDAARGEFAVLVDDDNVLAPDYLAHVAEIFSTQPRVGALGGKSLPEFESPPAEWTREFFPLLALRDPGNEPQISRGLRAPGATLNAYPLCAPIGAGMALRRTAWTAWLDRRRNDPAHLSDRRGAELTSSGDNDLVFCVMEAGWEVAYFPQLTLTHLIPRGRLEPDYLGRLNRGIQQSWMQVLALHHASPWPRLSRTGAQLRKAKAWVAHRAWSSPVARIRWAGACGHFDGRVSP